MKKKLLFIIESMTIGGTEKSLISLLKELDYSRYEVDLLLFYKKGEFLKEIPKGVNILEPLLSEDYDKAFNILLKKFKLRILVERIFRTIIFKITRDTVNSEVYSWSIRKLRLKCSKNYDCAISYMHHSSCLLYLVDKVSSNKKICYVHSDFSYMNCNIELYEKYFNKIDTIITVGKSVRKNFIKKFLSLKNKTIVINNILCSNEILSLARQHSPFEELGKVINIVTVARLESVKGVDIALDACKLLVSEEFNIKWHIIGEGLMRESLEEKIIKDDLSNRFILIGSQDNPYKYINYSDIYVQPSRSEARPLAVDEARLLCKPIVVTCYSEAKYQIQENKTGLICSINPQDLAQKISLIIRNRDIKDKFINNLIKNNGKEYQSIIKFYKNID